MHEQLILLNKICVSAIRSSSTETDLDKNFINCAMSGEVMTMTRYILQIELKQ